MRLVLHVALGACKTSPNRTPHLGFSHPVYFLVSCANMEEIFCHTNVCKTGRPSGRDFEARARDLVCKKPG